MVADYLAENGHQVVFTGSSRESALVTAILRMMKHEALDTAYLNLPLGPLAALVKNSRGLISNDTGVSHLAAALKKHSIVIFSETDPRRWAPLNDKLHRWRYRPEVSEVISDINRLMFKLQFVEEDV